MDEARAKSRLGVILRVGVFAFLEIAGLTVIPPLMMPVGGLFAAAALGTFASAAIANAVALRIYERGRLADIGLGWTNASVRNLGLGAAGGIGAALLVTAGPLITGNAELRPTPEFTFSWGPILFVVLVLLFGAVGEEMLFRGYGFQVLVASIGKFATVLPVGALFALAHAGNLNASWLGLANTFAWGILLGWAFLRSGDLWLPIGLHFGWNVTLPMFGVNLSGFTMEVTGHAMHWKTDPLWSGGAYGPEAGLLTTIVVGGLFYYLWRAPIQRQPAFLLRSLEED